MGRAVVVWILDVEAGEGVERRGNIVDWWNGEGLVGLFFARDYPELHCKGSSFAVFEEGLS
jgi:hypothetical protein